jgi:hypothetical protein
MSRLQAACWHARQGHRPSLGLPVGCVDGSGGIGGWGMNESSGTGVRARLAQSSSSYPNTGASSPDRYPAAGQSSSEVEKPAGADRTHQRQFVLRLELGEPWLTDVHRARHGDGLFHGFSNVPGQSRRSRRICSSRTAAKANEIATAPADGTRCGCITGVGQRMISEDLLSTANQPPGPRRLVARRGNDAWCSVW